MEELIDLINEYSQKQSTWPYSLTSFSGKSSEYDYVQPHDHGEARFTRNCKIPPRSPEKETNKQADAGATALLWGK